MTQSQLNQEGFIIIGSELAIEPITYRSYLNEYGKDETTTPRGIGDRLHVREVEVEDTDGDDTVIRTEWQMWTWGVGGNHPSHCGPDFDNEEDAELYYYERSEWYVTEKNWDAPVWCSTYDEAVTEMANACEKSEVIVRRYLKISEIAAKKAAAHRAQVTKEHDERKAWLPIEVPKEAATITIDDEFKSAVKWAEEAKGNEKSSRMASAMKDLLQRNNKAGIECDFWMVFRILKNKITM